MQAIGPQPHSARDDASVHYECHRTVQTKLERMVLQDATTFFAATEVAAGAELLWILEDEFDIILSSAGSPRAGARVPAPALR